MNDFQEILRRMANMERIIAHAHRSGTVAKSKDGKYIINWGPKTQGGDAGGGGAGGDSGSGGSGSGDGSQGSDGWMSPWITPTQHNGFMTSNTPFKVGQSVMSFSMDPEHLTALLVPHGPSDNNPRDGNATDDANTWRIRNDQQSSDNGGGGGGSQSQSADADGGGTSGQGSTQQAAKDDAEDVTWSTSYKKHAFQLGTKLTHVVDREAGTHTLTAENVSLQLAKDAVSTKSKDHTFDGDVLITGKLVVNGITYMGGSDASKKVSMYGSVDTRGDVQIGNQSEYAFTK